MPIQGEVKLQNGYEEGIDNGYASRYFTVPRDFSDLAGATSPVDGGNSTKSTRSLQRAESKGRIEKNPPGRRVPTGFYATRASSQ